MEDPSKTTDFDSVVVPVSVSSYIVQPHHRQSLPDVPEGIQDDIMLHFNDPNWDFRDNSSTQSISTDGMEAQRLSKISGRTGAGTEVNTVSHIPSWYVHDPKAYFSSIEQAQLRVPFLPSCTNFCSPVSFSSGIHLTPRSVPPSQIRMTKRCP